MTTLADQVKEFINSSEDQIGKVSIEHAQNNAEEFLNLTSEDFINLSKQECITAQYVLLQYSSSILKKINRYKALLSANKKTFYRHLSQVYNTYNSYNGQEIVYAQACAEHSGLREMDNEITKIEALIQDYEGLVFKIEKIAQTFKDLSFTR